MTSVCSFTNQKAGCVSSSSLHIYVYFRSVVDSAVLVTHPEERTTKCVLDKGVGNRLLPCSSFALGIHSCRSFRSRPLGEQVIS